MRILVNWFATSGIGVSDQAAASFFGAAWRRDPRWRVLSGCVDLRAFHQDGGAQSVRSELGIPSDALVFGHVGRFVKEKNHDFLVRIAKILTSAEPRARFVLLGGGPIQRQTEELVHALSLENKFIFLPPRDDVPRLMLGAFDFFLFPSLCEGLGLALVEAQAAGLRCFASTAVPPEAIVVPALVQQIPLAAGAQHWADVIRRQIHAPNLVTKTEALDAAERAFDIRQNAEELVTLYEAMAS